MKIVRSWLKEFLPDAPGSERLEELLAGLGLETESISQLTPPHRKVVFARVLEVQKLEGKEVRRLVLDIGQEVQVVSGAPNAKAGMAVALALPGAVLPDGTELGARKIAGLESYGMALSAKELGVGEYAGGLLEFAPDALPPGTPLAEVWGPDEVIEVEITPNRPDWLSVYGVARDLAALGLTLVRPSPKPQTTPLALPFGVWIEDTEGCDRFTLSYARGVKVGPSPLEVQRRLYAAGMRPISNVVDATNYTMLELGNPMHAYDAAFIREGLVVRRARPGEKLITLDGVERILDERDLLITVKEGQETRPAGLAGVMGGLEDEIRDTTTAVALEVAHFHPVRVRRTARRQGLKTEASYRFERGVDPDGPPLAAERFMELLQAWGGEGVEVAHERLDLNHTRPPKPIAFRPSYACKLVGMDYPQATQRQVLQRLGCTVQPTAQEEVWEVIPPSHRVDLTIEEDLVEEVARIVGYDQIPITLPSFFPHPDNLGVDAPYEATLRLKQVMAGLGFQEVLNYAWSSPQECELMRAPAPTVFMHNPQTPDRTALRTALYPGLLKNLQTALAQAEEGPFLLFEVGNVFNQTETPHIAALLCGDPVPGLWQKGLQSSFFALKGLLETAARNLGSLVRVEQETVPHLHPGISGAVYWNEQKVGHIGALHPAIAAALELPELFLFELTLPLSKGSSTFTDLAKYPASMRDLAVVVPESTPFAEVQGLIRASAGAHLEKLEIFDVYKGKPLEEGQKSLAFHLTFRHEGRTLTDLETDSFMQAIIAALEQHGFSIRR
ncbi:phenylalanine--tRNA ligase subunit beta [Meiothermus sp.]|uniref:phenylalanine--tRNA ligase subunit beta n=1 Tax=Meiothermus sp. TaxID=1955249 RepID=UPI0021DC62FF|nr:phenylalanine--tRNA ligase subunit beta [Meiothermus sp.]GIW33640.1 MAG: phenylalanine--tRNA ligase beta subunit [Meiothermus sp.]